MNDGRGILRIATFTAQFVGDQNAAAFVMLKTECCVGQMFFVNVAMEPRDRFLSMARLEPISQVVRSLGLLNEDKHLIVGFT